MTSLKSRLLKVCNDVQEPRQECEQVPNEVCENKPVTRTSYVDEEECELVTRQECSPVTSQECSNVVDRVPRQSSKQVGHTEDLSDIRTYTNCFLFCGVKGYKQTKL